MHFLSPAEILRLRWKNVLKLEQDDLLYLVHNMSHSVKDILITEYIYQLILYVLIKYRSAALKQS